MLYTVRLKNGGKKPCLKYKHTLKKASKKKVQKVKKGSYAKYTIYMEFKIINKAQ